jgi:hypothetical protein
LRLILSRLLATDLVRALDRQGLDPQAKEKIERELRNAFRDMRKQREAEERQRKIEEAMEKRAAAEAAAEEEARLRKAANDEVLQASLSVICMRREVRTRPVRATFDTRMRASCRIGRRFPATSRQACTLSRTARSRLRPRLTLSQP